ncbi:MAG: PD40 domain-containing protein [Deltaproteobacteria bacterium]|nr:PD40 domain-containing protein [Deltaproteobacteria bacterium]
MRRTVLIALVSWLAACEEEQLPPSTYYDEQIAPILQAGCVGQTTGCHTVDAYGVAAGNLDLSSYDALARRFDVLPPYGPYPLGLVFLKAGPPMDVTVDTFDPPDPAQPDVRAVRVRTDVRHNAGVGLEPGTPAFSRLQRWIADGFARNGAIQSQARGNSGSCARGVGITPGFSADVAPEDTVSYERFRNEVAPVLTERCAGGDCHGAALADLHLTCGADEAEQRWNYFVARQYLDPIVERSELTRRPLSPTQGGAFHGGGTIFETADDPGYQALSAWAQDLAERRPDLLSSGEITEGLRFFANRVQPVLVRQGCMFLACHSPLSFHELKLRGGGGGSFARPTTQRNYDLARHFLALESPDPNASRLVAKNLFPAELVPGGQGIVHRGGALLEAWGPEDPATPDDCEGIDAATAPLDEVPAYCLLVRWHAIEREEAVARGDVLAATEPIRGVVYVARPMGLGSPTDFDTYRPGADLRVATAEMNDAGETTLGASRSLLGACGLDPARTDIRGTTASWDGTRIAFGARQSESAPLRIFTMDADGSACARRDDLASDTDAIDGILLHDFDPAFAPDGRIVFASSRGNLTAETTGYAGPTRTPAALQPNANLYVFDPEGGEVRQLTYLLNQEMSPSFLANGRVVFTAEKREPGFRQLALRRQNLDGGDYHPLFAQRDSFGFSAGTDVIELLDHGLAFIAGDFDAPDGAGQLAIANRSIGPDQNDRDPADRFYLHSMTTPGANGLHRSPALLPSRRILVSCAQGATASDRGPFDWDLCEVDPSTRQTRVLSAEPGVAEVDAVALFARENRGVYVSRTATGEANASATVVPGELDAHIYFTDFPMIATLMFSNTRVGRPIDPRIAGFDVFEELPPPSSATSFDALAADAVDDDHGTMYVSRRYLGNVPLLADGSVRVRLPGGVPIMLHPTNADRERLDFQPGGLLEGPMVQRETIQYYPGERITQSIPRRFFNGVCGGCHGSITGREVDVAPNLDVLTGASQTLAREAEPVDIYNAPSQR